MNYMPIEFHTSILINKKVVKWGNLRISAPARAVSRAIEELIHIYAYNFTPYMRTKFQASILINKKSFETGGPRSLKGRFTANRRVVNRLSSIDVTRRHPLQSVRVLRERLGGSSTQGCKLCVQASMIHCAHILGLFQRDMCSQIHCLMQVGSDSWLEIGPLAHVGQLHW